MFSLGNMGQALLLSAEHPAMAVQPGLVKVKLPVIVPPPLPAFGPPAELPALPLAPPPVFAPASPPAVPPLLVPPAGAPACAIPALPAWLDAAPLAPPAEPPAVAAPAELVPALPVFAPALPPFAAPAESEFESVVELHAVLATKQDTRRPAQAASEVILMPAP